MVSLVMLPGGDQHHELNDDRCSVVDDSDNDDDGDDDDDDINAGEQLFGGRHKWKYKDGQVILDLTRWKEPSRW